MPSHPPIPPESPGARRDGGSPAAEPAPDAAAVERELAALDAALPTLEHPAPAWAERGRLLEALHRNASALAAYDRALAIDPALTAAWLGKALLLEDLDRPAEALAAYEGLLAGRPQEIAGWSNRAGLLAREGRFEEALASLERALALHPPPADRLALGLNKALLLAEGLDRPAQALAWLEQLEAGGDDRARQAIAWCRARLAK